MVRARVRVRGRAGLGEAAFVLAAVVVSWRLFMGWNWSAVPAGVAGAYRDPHGVADWVALHVAAVAGAGWLALRGRPVLGAAGVVLVLVVLSGWRMAVARAIGANLWPVGLAILAVTLSGACALAAYPSRKAC